MANHASAVKRNRQRLKKTARNRAGKSALRSALKKARTTIAGGNAEQAVLNAGFSAIDKAAKKGIIKGNAADRYKSRLSKAAKRTAAK